MKDNKIIKDLKERNDKLKMQYDFNNIHLISLENKYARLQTENTKLKQEKKEFRKYLESKINRMSGTTSHTYIDSLGKTVMVNRLIQDEYEEILEKLGE